MYQLFNIGNFNMNIENVINMKVEGSSKAMPGRI